MAYNWLMMTSSAEVWIIIVTDKKKPKAEQKTIIVCTTEGCIFGIAFCLMLALLDVLSTFKTEINHLMLSSYNVQCTVLPHSRHVFISFVFNCFVLFMNRNLVTKLMFFPCFNQVYMYMYVYEPWLGHGVVFLIRHLNSQCLSQPRCIHALNGYW